MTHAWSSAFGGPVASGRLRSIPADFTVHEELGFEPEGDGEHVFPHLEKTGLNTADLAQRLSTLTCSATEADGSAIEAIESGTEHITDGAVEAWVPAFDAEAVFA